VDLADFGGRLVLDVRPGGPDALEAFLRRRTPDMALMDADALDGRLAVRAWRSGDRMKPLGAPGERKLQDIFTDRKVRRARRHRTSILTLDDRPVWIVGHRIEDAVRVTEDTKRVAELVFRRT
jgi:tRNA(Ile)-lysidine synthase